MCLSGKCMGLSLCNEFKTCVLKYWHLDRKSLKHTSKRYTPLTYPGGMSEYTKE